METGFTAKARFVAFSLHEGKMYGRFPYCFHLADVVKNLVKFNYDDEDMIAAGYLHDVIEDCGQSEDGLSDLFNPKVAKLVAAVSGKGVNRKEKKADMIAKLQAYPKAVPLKMADRMANIQNCKEFNPRMLDMYRKEMFDYQQLFSNTNYNMWIAMENLL